MNETTILGAMATLLLALIGAVWSVLRGELAEHKSRVVSLEREVTRLSTEHARSEERDKNYDAGIERLTRAIDDFDKRIGAQIEKLSATLSRMSPGAYSRSMTPAARSYIGGPKKDEDK